jgi:prolipoprotein diacylglyceryltransferase
MSLCQYKNMFGFPNEGAHSIRIYNIAIVDVVATIIAAYFIHQYIQKNYGKMNISFIQTLFILFLIGIILHRLFCVRTTVDKVLFPNVNDK